MAIGDLERAVGQKGFAGHEVRIVVKKSDGRKLPTLPALL